jgi:beta-glucosidase
MSDNADVFYDEGLYVGYKWFDHHAVQPLFPFGHGLSYTSFEVCKIHVRVDKNLRVHVASSVTNTGSRDGREVAQLYVGYPQEAKEPPKLLKRFEKVSVKAGETKMVDFMLDSTTDLQYWSEDREGWAFASGEYTFYMGTSSRDIAWSETVNIKP